MLFLLSGIACIALDVGCCYRRMVSLCICLSVMFMSPAKTAELIKMPFGELTQVGPRNHVLDGDPQIPQGRHFGGLFQVAHWKAWGVLDWAVPKLLNQSRCHLGAESWNHVRKKTFAASRGDKLVMRPFVKSLWKLVLLSYMITWVSKLMCY